MKTWSNSKVFAAACMGMLLFGIVFLSLGTISTFIQQKFGLAPAGVASLAASLPFGMLAGTILFGPVADRYGYKYLLVLSSLLIMISLEMIAYAPTILFLQISFFLIGMGGGIINGATNALSADIATGSKGSKLSLLGVFFGIGALGMPVLIGGLSKIWNYETIISMVGLCLIIPIAYFLFIHFPEPKQKQGFPLKQGMGLLRDPVLLLFGFILFFESGIEGMVSNWTTTFLGNGNIPVDKALYALSVQVAAMVVARLILSRLLNKWSPRTILFMCLSIILAGSLLLFFAHSYLLVLIAMILFGIGCAAGFPVILGFTGDRYPQLSGTAFGIVIIIALIGNTCLNYSTGILSKTAGISFFPLLLALCTVIMIVLLGFVRRFPADRAD
jgi:MFS transporter, FHS family, glucose/mannose:H+ symporter